MVEIEAEKTDATRAIGICRAYRDAVAVQDACNGGGVIISFGRAMEAVRDDLAMVGRPGTDNVRRHPVFVLYASKLHDLAGLGLSDTTRFGLAFNFADSAANGAWMFGSEAYREAMIEYLETYAKRFD